MLKFIIVLILICLLAGIVYSSVIAVPDGYVGVATLEISNSIASLPLPVFPRSFSSGLHLTLPFVTHLDIYPTRVQMLYLDVTLAKGKMYRMTAQVRLDPDSALAIHHRIGPRYLQDVIKPTLTALVEKELYEYAGRMTSADQPDHLLATLRGSLSKDGLKLDEAILTGLEETQLTNSEESDTNEDTQ